MYKYIRRLSVIFVGLFFFANILIAFSEAETVPAVSSSLLELLMSSSLPSLDESRMETSLKNLKKDTQAIVEKNRMLLDKIKRFKARVIDLNKELQDRQASKNDLSQMRVQTQERLKQEVAETQAMRQHIKSLERSLATVGDDERAIQDQWAGKKTLEQSFLKRVEQLRQEIFDLRQKMQNLQSFKISKSEQERLRLNQLWQDELKALEEARRRYTLMQGRDPHRRELSLLKEHRASLQEQSSKVQQEIDVLIREQEQFQQEVVHQKEQGEDKREQLTAHIDDLQQRRDALSRLIQEREMMSEKGKSGFDVVALSKAIENLNLEKTLLNQQYTSLFNMFDVLEQFSKTHQDLQMMETDVRNMEEQTRQSKQEYEELQESLNTKQQQAVVLEKSFQDARASIEKTRKNIQMVREDNEKRLKQEERRLSKGMKEVKKKSEGEVDETKWKNDLARQQDRNNFLQKRVNLFQQEMETLVREHEEIEKEKESLRRESGQEQLSQDIERLEMLREQLDGTLKMAKIKFADMKAERLLWSSGEEKELKNHVKNLKEENQHLQAELLSLMVIQDKRQQRH